MERTSDDPQNLKPDDAIHEGAGHERTGHERTGHERTGHERTGHEATGHEGAGRDAARDGSGSAPRYSRRLSDKILVAFHHACDQGDFEVADQLLHVLEMMLRRRVLSPDLNRRRTMDTLVAAHERLWHLRHPQEAQV